MPTNDQKQSFLDGEGDAWFKRNRVGRGSLDAKIAHDPLYIMLAEHLTRLGRILEIGAANGWRLAALNRLKPELETVGIEPSSAADKDGAKIYPEVKLSRGTADELSFRDSDFDAVIFGFCLYLCDRGRLFRVAAEADRVLKTGGFLFILDFHTDVPYRNDYSHLQGMHSYKMDYASLFAWNPCYVMRDQVFADHSGLEVLSTDSQIGVTCLEKLPAEEAFPPNPFK